MERLWIVAGLVVTAVGSARAGNDQVFKYWEAQNESVWFLVNPKTKSCDTPPTNFATPYTYVNALRKLGTFNGMTAYPEGSSDPDTVMVGGIDEAGRPSVIAYVRGWSMCKFMVHSLPQ